MMVMRHSAAQAGKFPIAKPGCNDSCGDVSIPFPFGTREECSFNRDFLIDCNSTEGVNGNFTPFLKGQNISITNISLAGSLTVLLPVVTVGCYLNSSDTKLRNTRTEHDFSPFTVSNSANLAYVTGCNTYGLFQGQYGSIRTFAFGCISFCSDNFNTRDTSCSNGYGCCQTNVPSQFSSFTNSSLSSTDSGPRLKPGDCSYSFIAEKNSFNDSILGLKGSIDPSSKFPVVLSWVMTELSNRSCGVESRDSSNYACKAGSSCLNGSLGYLQYATYRCACSRGYEGNPYLGCTDINECVSPDDNDCEHEHGCVKTAGGYRCACPTGYFGDGRKSGTGCNRFIISSNKSNVLLTVGLTSLGISLLLATTFLLYKATRKRRDKNRIQNFFKKNGGHLLDQLSSNGNNIEKVHIFSAQELNKATDHFNENRVLGRGGQGTVYKGMLSDGTIIAVKKSKLVDAIEQFINEVVILAYIDHRNVVKLLGCCLETEVPLLVYEHIPNGTLYDLIHNNEGDDFTLSWEVRLRICKEVARALSYLHSATSIPVYHRDVKSSNILLDEKYKAKVSDFGISRHISMEQTHLTTLVQGTMGYLDPEYFQTGQLTDKSDVYSFGVVLVELLTGRKPISLCRVDNEESHVSSAAKFLQCMEDNSLHAVLDDRVLQEARVEDLQVVAKLARRCLSLEGRKRPTMIQVAMELEGIILQTPPLPSLVESKFNAGQPRHWNQVILMLTPPLSKLMNFHYYQTRFDGRFNLVL